jgi:hypothetical protein
MLVKNFLQVNCEQSTSIQEVHKTEAAFIEHNTSSVNIHKATTKHM